MVSYRYLSVRVYLVCCTAQEGAYNIKKVIYFVRVVTLVNRHTDPSYS